MTNMGDAAEMLLDGTLDAHTGEFIDGRSTGFPRTLDGSLPWEGRNLNPVNGLRKFVQDHTDIPGDPQAIINRYADEKKVKGNNFQEKCETISKKHFPDFRKWCKSQKP